MDEASLPSWSPNRYDRFVAGVVPLELVLARQDDAAVVARRIGAYPGGWELEIVWLSPDDRPPAAQRAPSPPAEESPDALRVEITYPDGRTARSWRYLPDAAVPNLMMLPLGGGGFAFKGVWRYWVWPLPSPGVLTFKTWWPLRDIDAVETAMDTQPILEAAKRSREIFTPSSP